MYTYESNLEPTVVILVYYHIQLIKIGLVQYFKLHAYLCWNGITFALSPGPNSAETWSKV